LEYAWVVSIIGAGSINPERSSILRFHFNNCGWNQTEEGRTAVFFSVIVYYVNLSTRILLENYYLPWS
jgi:hypothetical protein